MAVTKIIDGAYLVPMGTANAVLLDADGDLVLVDAGWPGKAEAVMAALGALGRRPGDLKHLILTHAHPDHIGSAAAILRATGARTYMHAADVPLAESGGPFRPLAPGPGPIRRLALRAIYEPNTPTEPFRIDRAVADGETLPLAGGLRVVHAPGHCAGQIALLWQGGRLLIAADAFINVLGPRDPIGFEDAAEGRRSQRRLAALAPRAVCFGHGGAIVAEAGPRLQRAAARR